MGINVGMGMPVRPVLFAAMSGMTVRENLGRGDRIANDIYLTNDPETKHRIVDTFLESQIGVIESAMIFNPDTILAYCQPTDVTVGSEHNAATGFLHELSAFERNAWMDFDNAIHARASHMWANGRIFLDYSEGATTQADGYESPIPVTRQALRELRDRQKDPWRAIERGTLVTIPNKAHSPSRNIVCFHYILNARYTRSCIDKIVNYCSALEALFATSTSELTHLLAERTAIASSELREERRATYGLVREAYKLRSTYTHGSLLKQSQIDSIRTKSVAMDDLVRKCVRRTIFDESLNDALKTDQALDDWFLNRLFA